jgi:hypothetical protein
VKRLAKSSWPVDGRKRFLRNPTFPRETRNREADDDDHLRVATLVTERINKSLEGRALES